MRCVLYRGLAPRVPVPSDAPAYPVTAGEPAVTRVLVTGGAGFIGSNLVRALLERGDDVRVLDNFATGSRENLAGSGDVEVVEGDLRSYERVHTAVRGAEVVFHQGALGSVPRSVQDPLTSTAVNVEGTLNVLLAARDEGVRRVVAASSSSVYGDGGDVPARRVAGRRTRSRRTRVAKLAAERFCVSFTPRLRARDGRAALLQRLRAAPGPDVAVRGRGAAVHHARSRTARPSRSTATASSRATSRTSRTSSQANLARGRRRRRRAAGCSTSRRAAPRP